MQLSFHAAELQKYKLFYYQLQKKNWLLNKFANYMLTSRVDTLD